MKEQELDKKVCTEEIVLEIFKYLLNIDRRPDTYSSFGNSCTAKN